MDDTVCFVIVAGEAAYFVVEAACAAAARGGAFPTGCALTVSDGGGIRVASTIASERRLAMQPYDQSFMCS